jgi:hypothetical protein
MKICFNLYAPPDSHWSNTFSDFTLPASGNVQLTEEQGKCIRTEYMTVNTITYRIPLWQAVEKCKQDERRDDLDRLLNGGFNMAAARNSHPRPQYFRGGMWREYDVTGNDAIADAVAVLRGRWEHESVMGVNVTGAVKGREGKWDETLTLVTVVGGRQKRKITKNCNRSHCCRWSLKKITPNSNRRHCCRWLKK